MTDTHTNEWPHKGHPVHDKDQSCPTCVRYDGHKPPERPETLCVFCWYRWWWWAAQRGQDYRIHDLLIDYRRCLSKGEHVRQIETDAKDIIEILKWWID